MCKANRGFHFVYVLSAAPRYGKMPIQYQPEFAISIVSSIGDKHTDAKRYVLRCCQREIRTRRCTPLSALKTKGKGPSNCSVTLLCRQIPILKIRFRNSPSLRARTSSTCASAFRPSTAFCATGQLICSTAGNSSSVH